MKKTILFIAVFFCFAFGGCSDKLQDGTFNVYFYFPSNTEVYLGQVRGLSQCQSRAWGYAREKGDGNARYDWSYICCLQTSSSSCSEKHK